MNRLYPDRKKAEELLQDAEKCNPGPWGDHSRAVAMCAEKIASACGNLDTDKAYVLGLLHDIGRKFGVKHFGHIYDGYMYMTELGYTDVAKICLTHSFCIKRIEDYIGNIDVTPEQKRVVEIELGEAVYDDYDLLIQLCDSIGAAEGVVPMESRMGDVKRRYGREGHLFPFLVFQSFHLVNYCFFMVGGKGGFCKGFIWLSCKYTHNWNNDKTCNHGKSTGIDWRLQNSWKSTSAEHI